LALCSDNVSSVVNNSIKPYRNALIRLRNAVNESNDNDQTRIEIEAALRDLVKLYRYDKSLTVTIKAGNKKVNNPSPIPDVPKCSVFETSFTKKVSINI